MKTLDVSTVRDLVLDQWIVSLEAALAAMGLEQAKVFRQSAISGSGPGDQVWWAQSLTSTRDKSVWAGADAKSWNSLGEAILSAVGIVNPGPEDVQAAYCDALTQSDTLLSRQLKQTFQVDINPGEFIVSPPPLGLARIDAVISAPSIAMNISVTVVFADELLQMLSESDSAMDSPAGVRSGSPVLPRHIAEIRFPLHVALGRTNLTLGQVFKLTVGSVILLDQRTTDPVEVRVNQDLIARGELVVSQGNYAAKVIARVDNGASEKTC